MSKQTCIQCGTKDELCATMCSKCGTPYPVPDPDEAQEIEKGQLIANRYVILGRIGQGGMGCIYKVQDNTLGEVVALKTLLPAYVQDKIVVDRFFNEARIARGLSHPHIVRVHDIGTADSIVYISMELLPGSTLRSMIDKMASGKRIPLNAILRMFDALCAALEYAHKYTVHRDIKPGNVMVLPDGTVKLMDFGISKLMSNPNLTPSSMVMGTPHYMSPEQLKNSADVDGRADIFSVGVMLYEALTGAIPTGLGQRSAIQNQIPPALVPIVQKCCNDDPLQRYQTVTDLRNALRLVREQFETGIKPGLATDSNIFGPATISAPIITAPSTVSRKLAALVAVGLICAPAYVGLSWAKGARMAALEQAAEDINAQAQADASKPVAQTGDSLTQVHQLIMNAKSAAVSAADSDLDSALLEEAKTLYKQATSTRSDDGAMKLSWQALHRYLAVAYAPKAMEFIPESESLSAFLIDIEEVSVGEFWRFVDTHKWRVHPEAKRLSMDDPISFVTYYDAASFLYSQQPAKRLPTEAHIEQAVSTVQNRLDENPDHEDGTSWGWENFFNLTRLKNEDQSPTILMETDVVILQVQEDSNSIQLSPPDNINYEHFSPNVGFRGVIELPTSVAEVKAWIKENNL
jgi:hypothetical protein